MWELRKDTEQRWQGDDNEGGEKGSKTEKKKEFIKGAKALREVGGEGESEFRGGTSIEKGFRERTSRQERRKWDKGVKKEKRIGWGERGGGSSVTACSTKHRNTGRLFAVGPIQKLISEIISVLLKWGLRCEMLQPCKRLSHLECVCSASVCVCSGQKLSPSTPAAVINIL